MEAAAGQADDGVQHAGVPDQPGAYVRLRPAAKEDAVGQQHRRPPILLHVPDHVLDEGEILVGSGGQAPRALKAGI